MDPISVVVIMMMKCESCKGLQGSSVPIPLFYMKIRDTRECSQGHTVGLQSVAFSQITTTHGILLSYSAVLSVSNSESHILSSQCWYFIITS